MADWADEAAMNLWHQSQLESSSVRGINRLAAALRDAYARGVRGAAEVVREQARVAGLQAGEGAHEEALLLGAADAILALLKGE